MNDKSLSSNGESSNQHEQSSPVIENIKSKSLWLRLFHMLVLGMLYSLSRAVLGAVVVVQFFWLLLTTKKNEQLVVLGKRLAVYGYQISLYLTFNTEERPYPYDLDWPDED